MIKILRSKRIFGLARRDMVYLCLQIGKISEPNLDINELDAILVGKLN
jgi:hypothetical protein